MDDEKVTYTITLSGRLLEVMGHALFEVWMRNLHNTSGPTLYHADDYKRAYNKLLNVYNRDYPEAQVFPDDYESGGGSELHLTEPS